MSTSRQHAFRRPYRNQAGWLGLDMPEKHRLLDRRKATTHLKHTQIICPATAIPIPAKMEAYARLPGTDRTRLGGSSPCVFTLGRRVRSQPRASDVNARCFSTRKTLNVTHLLGFPRCSISTHIFPLSEFSNFQRPWASCFSRMN